MNFGRLVFAVFHCQAVPASANAKTKGGNVVVALLISPLARVVTARPGAAGRREMRYRRAPQPADTSGELSFSNKTPRSPRKQDPTSPISYGGVVNTEVWASASGMHHVSAGGHRAFVRI
jgi:hypothetical protein